jgi:hypothetical protein
MSSNCEHDLWCCSGGVLGLFSGVGPVNDDVCRTNQQLQYLDIAVSRILWDILLEHKIPIQQSTCGVYIPNRPVLLRAGESSVTHTRVVLSRVSLPIPTVNVLFAILRCYHL